MAKYAGKVKNDYDIINIYAPFGFLYGFARRMRGSQAGPPDVMTIHGIEERRNYAMGGEAKKGRTDYFRWRNRVWQNSYHMRTYRWSIKTADQCIVTNREALLILQLGCKLPPDRVWFSANGIGEEYFHRRSFSDSPVLKLLFVGTWIDHKGIYSLAEAFGELLALFPAVQLTIAGCAEPRDTVLRCFPPGDGMDPGGDLSLIDPYHLSRVRPVNFQRRAAKRAVCAQARPAIHWIESFSQEAAKTWKAPIDFLLIDGDHAEDAVQKDWEDWHPHVVDDGIVAFHDARLFASGWTSPVYGPVKFSNRFFRDSSQPGWAIIDEVDSLVMLRKSNSATPMKAGA